MGSISSYKDCLYFVPVVSIVHHARELYEISRELDEISELFPPALRGRVSKAEYCDLLPEIEAMSVAQKIKISNCFEKRNRCSELAYEGSIAQLGVTVIAGSFNPTFLFMSRLSSLQNLFSLYKIISSPTRFYHYDQNTGVEGRQFTGVGFLKLLDKILR